MHPTELDLLDFATGEAFDGQVNVAEHVGSCARCAALVETFTSTGALVGEELPNIEVERSDSLVQAITEPPPNPAPGQLWRAEWDGTVQLLLIVSATDATMEAVPLIDAEALDEASVSIGMTLGWNSAVVAADLATLPIRVLDRYLGTLSTGVVDRVRSVARGEPGDGDPIVSKFDERWASRVQTSEQIAMLADATWVPQNAEPDIPSLLHALWSRPQLLANDLGVRPGQATQILVGNRLLNDDQRRVVEQRLGREIGPAAPAADVVWAFDHPSLRMSWRAKARRAGTHDSPTFRWDTYLNSSFALAARTTGGLSARERILAMVKQVLDDGA